MSGKALVVDAGRVKVGLGPLNADSQCVPGFLQGGDAGVGGGGELVECVPVIGADTGGLFGCGGLGALGANDGGGLSPACPARIALGLVSTCLGVGDLAGGVLPGGADIAVGVLTGLADLFSGTVTDAA